MAQLAQKSHVTSRFGRAIFGGDLFFGWYHGLEGKPEAKARASFLGSDSSRKTTPRGYGAGISPAAAGHMLLMGAYGMGG